MTHPTTEAPAAVRYCIASTTLPHMPNPAARIGAWLAGVCSALKTDTIEVSYRQIQLGLSRGGFFFEGTGCHNATIRESMQWLEQEGLIATKQGEYTGGGHHAVAVTVMP